MAGKAIRKESIKKNTIQNMIDLNTYKPEYDSIIDIYSELREQYEILTKKFKSSGYKYGEPSAQGGNKKSPLVSTLECLRKDILQYSDRLQLNPKSLDEKARGSKKESNLAKALSKLG